MQRSRVVVVVAALALTVGACSGSDDDRDASADATPSTQQTDSKQGTKVKADGENGGGTVAANEVAPSEHETANDGDAQSPVLDRIEGDKSGTCVDTAGKRDARSGGIAAGPFDEVRSSFGTTAPGKPANPVRVYLIPRHGADAGGLTLRVSRVGGGPSSTITKASVGNAEGWSFYDTEVPLDGPGTWRLRATSGADRGCFDVTVGE